MYMYEVASMWLVLGKHLEKALMIYSYVTKYTTHLDCKLHFYVNTTSS